jgi:hypothetical protein
MANLTERENSEVHRSFLARGRSVDGLIGRRRRGGEVASTWEETDVCPSRPAGTDPGEAHGVSASVGSVWEDDAVRR